MAAYDNLKKKLLGGKRGKLAPHYILGAALISSFNVFVIAMRS